MCVCVCVCLSLSLSLLLVFLSFDGSEINIIGFALHLTNGFFLRVLRFSHSSPGMFGIGSLLFPRSDPKHVAFFSFLFFSFFFFLIAFFFFSLSLSHESVFSKAQNALSHDWVHD